jgi:hypothetical protein
MKMFFIYSVANNTMLGRVYAKDWVDARSQGAKDFGYTFGQVFACVEPLPIVK